MPIITVTSLTYIQPFQSSLTYWHFWRIPDSSLPLFFHCFHTRVSELTPQLCSQPRFQIILLKFKYTFQLKVHKSAMKKTACISIFVKNLELSNEFKCNICNICNSLIQHNSFSLYPATTLQILTDKHLKSKLLNQAEDEFNFVSIAASIRSLGATSRK